MSARNGGPRHANSRVRFKSDYSIINVSFDDTQQIKDANTQFKYHLGGRKRLGRCESIGTQYERIASTFEYEDELLCATLENDLKKCKELIENGAEVNKHDSKFGVTALHVAARMNYLDILQFLLTSGADINLRSNDGPNSLHIAIRQKAVECCYELLKHPHVNIFLEDNEKNKCLPLHIASKIGNYDICARLLELDPSLETINKTDKNKRTPLHEASAKGFTEIVALFLNNNADWDVKDKKSYYPIHLAAQKGYEECCLSLLGVENKNQPRKLTKNGSSALMLAAQSGNHKCCELLKEYCDINATNKSEHTALHYATNRGFNITVEKLVDWGAEVLKHDDKGNTPIHEAAGQKNTACLEILCRKVDFQDPGNNDLQQNVLHISAQKVSSASLSFLLKKDSFRAKVNEIDMKQMTPLHYAVRKGDSECSQILLENDADPLIRDKDNNLPLHIAAAKNLQEVCKLLSRNRNKDSVNCTNNVSATPLHLAAVRDAKECCSLLVFRGASIDSKDRYGNAPIHIAAKLGNVSTLSYFIKQGMAVNRTVESTGDTSLHLASREGHLECCKLLLKSSKKSIEILNKVKKSPIDAAVENNQDEIFEYLLLGLPNLKKEEITEPKYTKDLQKGLHYYMHVGLDEKREIILRTLVQSHFWFACFNPDLCEKEDCSNFNSLIISHPDLAKIIFDKCTEKDKRKFNFEHFESQLYNTSAGSPSKYPFDRQTGKLLENTNKRDKYQWLAEHPLRKAIDNEHLQLLVHPLTSAYLKYKWSSYVRNIFFILLLFEFLSVIVFSINIGYSWNYSHLNVTSIANDDICKLADSEDVNQGKLLRNAISVIQIAVLVLHLILEIYFCFEMKKSYFFTTPCETICKMLRCLGIFLFCIPTFFCSFDLGIKMGWQWQIGIITLLLCWSLFIHKLNQLPVISVFMPVTRKFLLSFSKVLLYIFLILLIFAYTFYLLLDKEGSFSNIHNAFIKSIVWMLGDLNYDSTFVENLSQIRYPTMAKLIFIFFVTSITFFIVNLVLTNPSDHLSVFREKATIHKASSRVMLFLKLDTVFVQTRRMYSRSFWTEDLDDISGAKLILNFIEKLDSRSVESEQDKMRKDIQLLNKKVDYLIEKNAKFLKFLDERSKAAEGEQEKAKKDFEDANVGKVGTSDGKK